MPLTPLPLKYSLESSWQMLPIAIYQQHIDIDFDVIDILLLINFVCVSKFV